MPTDPQTICRSFILLLACVATPSVVSGEKLLRWNLVPSDVIRVQIDQEVQAETSLMGNEANTSAHMTIDMNWQVRQVSADGVAEIQQSIDRFQMKLVAPGHGPIELDTAAANPSDPMGQMLLENVRPMIGLKILQQMNNRGEILNVRLSPEAEQRLQRDQPGPLQEMFSPEGVKSLMNQSTAVLPEQPVSPGDTWTGSSTTQSPAGDMRMDLSYVYRGTIDFGGRPVERIDVGLQMHLGDSPPAGGVQIELTDQSGEGIMLFDAAVGRFVQSRIRQNLTLNTKLGEANNVQKMSTNMQIDFRSENDGVARRPSGRSSAR